MQPIKVDHIGSTLSSLDHFNGAPHVAFNKSANVVCIYDPQHIKCYRGPSQWSYMFTWHISEFESMGSHNPKPAAAKIEGYTDSWVIETVRFGSHSNHNLRYDPTDSMLVGLVNRDQSLTCLCYFSDLNDKRNVRSIYLHGLVTVSEWISTRSAEPVCPTSPESPESSTMLLDTTDVHTTKCMARNVDEPLQFCNDYRDWLSVGFRQGLVGVIGESSVLNDIHESLFLS